MKKLRRNRPIELRLVIPQATRVLTVRVSRKRAEKLSQPRFVTEIKA